MEHPVQESRQSRYASKRRADLGNDEYRRQENAKRKARRLNQQARERAAIVDSPEYTQELESYTSALIKAAKHAKSAIGPTSITRPEVSLVDVKRADAELIRGVQATANCEKLESNINAVVDETSRLHPDMKRLPAPGTVRIYVRTVAGLYKKLHGGELDCADFAWLEDVEGVTDFITATWENEKTRATKFTHVTGFLRWIRGMEQTYKAFSSVASKKVADNTEEASDNRLSGREARDFLPWGEITAAVPSASSPRDLALLSIYTLMPPRRAMDVFKMKISIMTKTQIEALNGTRLDKKWNWLVLTKGRGKLGQVVYNRYKTAKHYGQQVFEVPPELVSILKSYIQDAKLQPEDPLFPSRKGTHLSGTQFTTQLTSAVASVTAGEGFSVNGFRHAYASITFARNPSQREIKEAAWAVGNSPSQFVNYNRVDL